MDTLKTVVLSNAAIATRSIAEDAYECPECGAGHDGMTTGTERCPECAEGSDVEEDSNPAPTV